MSNKTWAYLEDTKIDSDFFKKAVKDSIFGVEVKHYPSIRSFERHFLNNGEGEFASVDCFVFDVKIEARGRERTIFSTVSKLIAAFKENPNIARPVFFVTNEIMANYNIDNIPQTDIRAFPGQFKYKSGRLKDLLYSGDDYLVYKNIVTEICDALNDKHHYVHRWLKELLSSSLVSLLILGDIHYGEQSKITHLTKETYGGARNYLYQSMFTSYVESTMHRFSNKESKVWDHELYGIDMVICTGDVLSKIEDFDTLAKKTSTEEEKSNANQIKKESFEYYVNLIDKLEATSHIVVPGNHDIPQSISADEAGILSTKRTEFYTQLHDVKGKYKSIMPFLPMADPSEHLETAEYAPSAISKLRLTSIYSNKNALQSVSIALFSINGTDGAGICFLMLDTFGFDKDAHNINKKGINTNEYNRAFNLSYNKEVYQTIELFQKKIAVDLAIKNLYDSSLKLSIIHYPYMGNSSNKDKILDEDLKSKTHLDLRETLKNKYDFHGFICGHMHTYDYEKESDVSFTIIAPSLSARDTNAQRGYTVLNIDHKYKDNGPQRKRHSYKLMFKTRYVDKWSMGYEEGMKEKKEEFIYV